MRYGLLARVSGEEQVEGYSLDAQVRAFNTLVETREGSVYHQWIEEGVSARTDDISNRALFRSAIDEALAGRYDVLVVHKLDRFSPERAYHPGVPGEAGESRCGIRVHHRADGLLHTHR